MIKGVNRQMIEVIETENKFYERALFVVRPEYADKPQEQLHTEAQKVLGRMGAPSSLHRKNKLVYWGWRLGAAAAGGAGVALLLLNL